MTDPASIGFSLERLARIETWCQAQIDAGAAGCGGGHRPKRQARVQTGHGRRDVAE